MRTSKRIMKRDPRVTVMQKTEKISNLNKPGVVGVTQEKDSERCITKILAAKQNRMPR